MEQFGRFIDDIRKEIPDIQITFEMSLLGDSMSISVPPSTVSHLIDTRKVGKIEYDTPMYDELLEMIIEWLHKTKKHNDTKRNNSNA